MNRDLLPTQTYNQVSILRSTSKVKLDHTLLLGFGLKELKWVHKSTFKFHFLKSQQKCIFSAFV